MGYKQNEWELAQAKADTLRRFLPPGHPFKNWLYRRIGKAIKAYRADQKISQAELARRMDNIPAPMLSIIEKGNQPFYLHDYVRISKALGITLNDLLDRSKEFQ